MRKKQTPLEQRSLVERGIATTSEAEELSAGFIALERLRSKQNDKMTRLFNIYTMLAVKISTSTGKAKLDNLKEFKKSSDAMFKQAHKIGSFDDTRIAASAMLQAINYLRENPTGSNSALAINLIRELDKTPSNFGYTEPHESRNPIWMALALFLTYKFITSRNV